LGTGVAIRLDRIEGFDEVNDATAEREKHGVRRAHVPLERRCLGDEIATGQTIDDIKELVARAGRIDELVPAGAA